MLLRSLTVVTATLALLNAVTFAADPNGFTDTFPVARANLTHTGRNDFLILEPGYQLILEGESDGKPARLVITVLDKTRKVDDVETRIVEEHETIDGKLVEISRNFLAIDKTTNDVYYLGEEVDEYKDDKITGHAGAWRSGKAGAKFGLLLPARPAVGQKHYQELAPKVAMDRSEVVAVDAKVSTPAGNFDRCLQVRETTPLEPDVTQKVYAPGVGMASDGELKLVKHGFNVEPLPKRPAPTPRAAKPPLVAPWARDALALVGDDPDAELAWAAAINDDSIPPSERSDLIEDLNEHGFADPRNVTPDELPLVINRLALIEELAPDAMDQTNADAFAEAYKDLVNIAMKLLPPE